MAKHCNSYGFAGAFAAITAAVAWVLVKSKDENCLLSYDKLNMYHTIMIVTGIVICIGSLFALASLLRDIHQVINIVGVVLIALVGCLAVYSAYYSFFHPCMKGFGLLDGFGNDKNIFSSEDGKMIAVFILDIVTALLLFSSAGSFSNSA